MFYRIHVTVSEAGIQDKNERWIMHDVTVLFVPFSLPVHPGTCVDDAKAAFTEVILKLQAVYGDVVRLYPGTFEAISSTYHSSRSQPHDFITEVATPDKNDPPKFRARAFCQTLINRFSDQVPPGARPRSSEEPLDFSDFEPPSGFRVPPRHP
jgi:hypothetical protein